MRKVNALDKIIEHQDWVAEKMGAKRPQVDSILAPFSKENVYVGLARVARDTSRYPAWFRLVAAHEDTLMISVDSLRAMKARKDSLEAVKDTLSVAKDTLAAEAPESPEQPAVEPPKEKLRPRQIPERPVKELEVVE